MGIIKLKRGNKANLGTVTLQAGEPAFVLDDKEFYVGDGTDKILINPIKSVAGKTGIVTLTKQDVGLNNVTNESKETMFTSPTLTGTPTSTTPTAGDNTTKIATTAFVTTAVNNKTSVSGNAGTASKLQTARTITLTGSITGSANFDGSQNITITTTGNGSDDIDGGTF
ncbi:hypothetical protein [Clostridium sp. 1001275B_160808_H3]|uniref:hyaluronate lyase N-terminal domain-containing protein n=1 Tax=Clostridium sp. 1001275B_160808_H3 TaxID=2787110 RepID=UPI00189B2BB0|nr:hypothetical protein [Clostridium sp. 1001275B_160808_H3]